MEISMFIKGKKSYDEINYDKLINLLETKGKIKRTKDMYIKEAVYRMIRLKKKDITTYNKVLNRYVEAHKFTDEVDRKIKSGEDE